MDFGNGIHTDGPVCGAQATAPGQAVMLGDDMKIPSGFVSGGGSQILHRQSGDQIFSLIDQAEIGTTFTFFPTNSFAWLLTGTKVAEVTSNTFYGIGFHKGKLATCIKQKDGAVYVCGSDAYGSQSTVEFSYSTACNVCIR